MKKKITWQSILTFMMNGGLEFYEFMAVKNIIEQQIESYLLMVEHDRINQNERDHG